MSADNVPTKTAIFPPLGSIFTMAPPSVLPASKLLVPMYRIRLLLAQSESKVMRLVLAATLLNNALFLESGHYKNGSRERKIRSGQRHLTQ